MAPPRNLIRAAVRKAKDHERKKIIQEKKILISEVERRPPIWDRSLATYRQKDVVDDMWVEVAASMHKEKEQCKKIWKNLLDHFREILQNLQHTASGSGMKHIPKITWPYFQVMLFMKPILEHRSTTSSILELDELSTPQEILPDVVNCEVVEEKYAETLARVGAELENGSEEVDTRAYCQTPTSSESLSSSSEQSVSKDTWNKKGKKQQRASRNKALLQEPRRANSQLNVKRERLEIFGEYVADLLKDVPVNKQTRCQYAILNIIKEYTEGFI